MIKYIVKKWLLKQLNKLLNDYQCNVKSAQVNLSVWIGRLQSILNSLVKMLGYLDDNKLDENEIDSTANDIREVIEKW